MPAYARYLLNQFAETNPAEIVGILQEAYAVDGFSSQYTRQTKAWASILPKLQHSVNSLLAVRPEAANWSILLEFPLYRLRRRIDVVILAHDLIVVIEYKVGAKDFTSEDRRQVEEYALDLSDFHSSSHSRTIFPVLWCTEAPPSAAESHCPGDNSYGKNVETVFNIGEEGLFSFLAELRVSNEEDPIAASLWDRSPYRPVPNIIDAATSIFAGHNVRSIANADAENLASAAARLIELVENARACKRRYLVMLTGVPGSGKTLVGLDVVHSAIATGIEHQGDIVYLSGNTPLVNVLREALARDEQRRGIALGNRRGLGNIRREVRARIQHINDFLKESFRNDVFIPPHEHVIVFDEAQRAWDQAHGKDKFERTASEPALLLELMSRHRDWCACICLIGRGQEINSGEDGVFGWGEALRRMTAQEGCRWSIFAPASVLSEDAPPNKSTLGRLPNEISAQVDNALELTVPQRSFRSPDLSIWIDNILSGDSAAALAAAERCRSYPLIITRSSSEALAWLRQRGRGERRFGLLASSGARRLRAEGFGVTLNANSGDEIAQWYLNPRGDIRSSYALEVPANEYTCQGLEIDFACICWGGDLVWCEESQCWAMARFSGTVWQQVRNTDTRRFLMNTYRVLMTRAREGLVIWVPPGDQVDRTRAPGPLDATANFLLKCGVKLITETES
jgi:hypothetical protein